MKPSQIRMFFSPDEPVESILRFAILEKPSAKLRRGYDRAYAIRWFSTTFTRPNPFDVDKVFQAPMEKLLSEADGDKGKTSISGTSLDAGLLEKLTRSTAASGNNAQARIQFEEHAKPVLKQLKGNIVALEIENLDSTESKVGLLDRIRDIYHRIRHRSERSHTE